MSTASERLSDMKRRFGAGRFIELEGLRLHYAEMGQGPPLVLVHGWPEFWLTWHRVMPALAADFRVIAPDLRGFGESRSLDRPPGAPLTPQIVTEDLIGLLDALAIERAGFVGHDIGANALQTLARSHPERVAGLFFFNCPHPGIGRRWADADSIPEIWYQSFHQLDMALELLGRSRENVSIYIRWVLAHWSHDPETFAEDAELWVETFSAPGALEGGFAWYKGIDEARRKLMREGPPSGLPKIAAPTRVLWGASDPILKPAWRDTLPDTFSDLSVDVLPDAGHFVHYERPGEAAAALRRFFGALDFQA